MIFTSNIGAEDLLHFASLFRKCLLLTVSLQPSPLLYMYTCSLSLVLTLDSKSYTVCSRVNCDDWTITRQQGQNLVLYLIIFYILYFPHFLINDHIVYEVNLPLKVHEIAFSLKM